MPGKEALTEMLYRCIDRFPGMEIVNADGTYTQVTSVLHWAIQAIQGKET